MPDIENQEGLIQIKQLPVIIEQLSVVKQEVEEKTNVATKLVCNEDNYKEIKKVKSTLTKEFKEWEARRKEVKLAIMAPYQKFDEVYKDCISNAYQAADAELKKKIDVVESGLKTDKQEKILKYYKEYSESLGIDFVNFERIGCNINLTVTLKKLKEQVKDFLDKTMDDLKLIALQEYKAEILVEYKQSLNVAQAITTISERYKAIEVEKERLAAEEAERQKALEQENINSQAFEPFTANVPVEIENPEEIHECDGIQEQLDEVELDPKFPLTFTVYGTKKQLKEFAVEIKKMINERGMTYE